MAENTVKLLEKVLDYTTARQKVISKNIANVNTVNYQREDVSFEEILNSESSSKINRTNSKHFPITEVKLPNQPDFIIDEKTENENVSGFNNVDMDTEMAEMAQNSILFKFASQKLKSHFTSLQSVIKGDSR